MVRRGVPDKDTDRVFGRRCRPDEVQDHVQARTTVDDRRRSTRVQERRMTVGVSVQYDLHVDNSE